MFTCRINWDSNIKRENADTTKLLLVNGIKFIPRLPSVFSVLLSPGGHRKYASHVVKYGRWGQNFRDYVDDTGQGIKGDLPALIVPCVTSWKVVVDGTILSGPVTPPLHFDDNGRNTLETWLNLNKWKSFLNHCTVSSFFE